MNKLYSYNDNYFESIDTEEKAYWLGFLAADGSINSNRNTIKVALAVKDADHVVAFGQAISSTAPVRTYANNGSGSVETFVTSPIMASHLARFGIVARKTETVPFPELGSAMYQHYIRGYFDGDGCFAFGQAQSNGRTKSWASYSVLGNEAFLQSLQAHLTASCDLKPVKLFRRRPDCPVFHFHYCGVKNCRAIYSYLYNNATVFLARKKSNAERWLSTLVPSIGR